MAEAIRMTRDAGAVDPLALSLIEFAGILSAAGRPPEAFAAMAEASRWSTPTRSRRWTSTCTRPGPRSTGV